MIKILKNLKRDTIEQICYALLTLMLYTFFTNFAFAMLFVGSIAFHEFGHLYVAKKFGLKTGGMYLFPMMGGVCIIKEPPSSYWRSAIISMAGPAFGLLQVSLFAALGLALNNPWLFAAASFVAIFNLFNLLPLAFLDGGKIFESVFYSFNTRIGFRYKVISTLCAIPILFFLNKIIMAIVIFYSIMPLLDEMKGNLIIILKKISKLQMVQVFGMYLFLVGSLLLMKYISTGINLVSFFDVLL